MIQEPDRKTYLHLTINSIASANCTRTTATSTTVVAPVAASLSVGTIAGHMASIATDATDNVGSEVSLFGAIILAMSDLTT